MLNLSIPEHIEPLRNKVLQFIEQRIYPVEKELFETDRILMTSVDTGWITDERPHPTKVRLAEEGFHAPLDLVDGAARVYDPIVRGEAGEDLFGVFLKDYTPGQW